MSTSTDFVLVHSDWSGNRARRLLDTMTPTFVVIRRVGPPEGRATYYAVRRRLALDAFERQPEELVGVSLPEGDKKIHVVEGKRGLVGVREERNVRAKGTSNVRPGRARSWGPNELTRELAATIPNTVGKDASVSLLVSLVTPPGKGGFTAPSDAVIDIVIDVTNGLAVEAPSEKTCAIDSDLPLRFKILGKRVGPAAVTVLAFHSGACVGRLILNITVIHAAPTDVPPTAERMYAAFGRADKPDLSIIVFESADRIEFRVQSRDDALYMKKFGPVTLTEPDEYFRGFFQEIERLPVGTPEERRSATQKLRSKGMALFDSLFPRELRETLWALRDSIDTMQIMSEEPWIPWEFCCLKGRTGGKTEDGQFFAEAFAISRWLQGVPATTSLPLRNVALVVPTNSGLKNADRERRHILSLKSKDRDVTEIEPTYLAVVNAMASGEHDAWHFTGHGRADKILDADQMYIELNDARLTPVDVSGRVENMLAPRPLVFLNACQTGQGRLSLTGPGGWARRFLRSDGDGAAAAFIGTYWSVDDEAAFEFATLVYAELLSGTTIAKAIQRARLAMFKKGNGDPTWLAYTLYAHPNAAIQSTP